MGVSSRTAPSAKATYAFSSDESGSAFVCIDLAGNQDESAATDTFKVRRKPKGV